MTQKTLGEQAFTAAWKAGEQLTLEETVAFVLEQQTPASNPVN